MSQVALRNVHRLDQPQATICWDPPTSSSSLGSLGCHSGPSSRTITAFWTNGSDLWSLFGRIGRRRLATVSPLQAGQPGMKGLQIFQLRGRIDQHRSQPQPAQEPKDSCSHQSFKWGTFGWLDNSIITMFQIQHQDVGKEGPHVVKYSIWL